MLSWNSPDLKPPPVRQTVIEKILAAVFGPVDHEPRPTADGPCCKWEAEAS